MPNEHLGFLDYNLDGLLDQGEVRVPGSENYIVDAHSLTANDGTNSLYPWNRRRLVEDCIEVIDDSGLDFDEFVDPVAKEAYECSHKNDPQHPIPLNKQVPPTLGGGSCTPNGVCSGIVLLPVDAHPDHFLAFGEDPFQLPPEPWLNSSSYYYPIHNQDNDDPTKMYPPGTDHYVSWNIFFPDVVVSLGAEGNNSGQIVVPDNDFYNDALRTKTAYAAHEYLHIWENFPDLYDYDLYWAPGITINTPIGQWDIMAGQNLGPVPLNLVHSIPIFKEKPGTEWIAPVDLTMVLTPGVDTPITLPPAELVRDESYFFLENENLQGTTEDNVERLYLWSAGGATDKLHFDQPGFPGFTNQSLVRDGMPAAGMLLLHTDVDANPEALPKQRKGTRPAYRIREADGLGELNAGIWPYGDDGDPWPGSTGKTEFNFNTNPPSQWYAQNSFTGLNILDIVPDGLGSILVTLNWVPMSIPSLRFLDPPGGESVEVPGPPPAVIYQVRAEATDVYGGTWLRFFYTDDETDLTLDPDGGNYIGAVRKTTPGTHPLSLDWNIMDVPDDRYFVFAQLIPGEGADGTEASVTVVRPGRNNVGDDGTLTVNVVDTNEVVVSGPSGTYTSTTTFQAVDFLAAGVQVGNQLTTGAFSDRQPALRTITAILNGGLTLELSAGVSTTGAVTNGWQVTRSDRTARLETWTVECIDTAGTEWTVYSSLSQPVPADDDPDQDPYPHAFTDVAYISAGGEVTFTLAAGTTAFGLGDTFAFTTTGLTDLSAAVTVLNGQISEGPIAVIDAQPLSGYASLNVHFDGRDSWDPNGEPLTFVWDFGDGSNPVGPSVVDHTYQESGTFTAILRVTNPDGRFGETGVDIVVINNSPNAHVTAEPTSGPLVLDVLFDGSQSSDNTETPKNELIYQWEFGDGETANDAGAPGTHFATVSHVYTAEGVFIAKLTVTDTGGKQDTATISIMAGNTHPVPSVYYRPGLTGPDPWTVKFNANQSFDADGDPLTVQWDWGDGSNTETYPALTGVDGDGYVPHEFHLVAGETEMIYHVSAVITDGNGGSAVWPGVGVRVTQAQEGYSHPRALFSIAPDPPLLNEVFQVDGHMSHDRPDSTVALASYSWNFGDGSPVITSDSPVATHTYTVADAYTISLTVADNETPPNTNTLAKTVIVLGEGDEIDDEDNLAPTARMSVSPSTGYAGVTEFTFNGEFSSDADDDALTYRWFFGDGQTATGVEVTHMYNTPGDYFASLMVSDPKNASNVDTQTIGVFDVGDNRSPVAFIATGPRSGTAPVSLTFDGSISYDPDGDPLVYNWRFRLDGEIMATASNALVTVRFDEPGTYAVELEVADDRGGSDATEPEVVVIAERGTLPDPDPTVPTDPDEGHIPPSEDQRPGGGGICGLGMVMSFFGSLLGLAGLAGARRRRLL